MYCHQTNHDIHSTNAILRLTQIHSHNTRLVSKIDYAFPKKELNLAKNLYICRTIDMAEYTNRTQLIKLWKF